MKEDLAKPEDSLCGPQLPSLLWPRQLPTVPATMGSAQVLGMTKVLPPNVSFTSGALTIHTHVQTS